MYTPVIEPRRAGRKHLTMTEWRRVLAAARAAGLFEHVLLRVMYEPGLRAAEPGALVFDHLKRLREKPPQLYVPRGKGSVTGWQEISPELATLLWQWVVESHHLRANRAPREAAQRWPAAPVFLGAPRGGRRSGICRKTVWRTVKRLMDAARVPPALAHPHAIKHSRVQHIFEEAEKQGLPAEAALKTVAQIVGHKTARTSWEHYVAQTGRGKQVAEAVLKEATK